MPGGRAQIARLRSLGRLDNTPVRPLAQGDYRSHHLPPSPSPLTCMLSLCVRATDSDAGAPLPVAAPDSATAAATAAPLPFPPPCHQCRHHRRHHRRRHHRRHHHRQPPPPSPIARVVTRVTSPLPPRTFLARQCPLLFPACVAGRTSNCHPISSAAFLFWYAGWHVSPPTPPSPRFEHTRGAVTLRPRKSPGQSRPLVLLPGAASGG